MEAFEKQRNCFSKQLHYFTILPAMSEALISPSSPTVVIFPLFYYSHTSRCALVSHLGLDLYFSDSWWWPSFHMLIHHLYIFSGEIPIWILCLSLNWSVFSLLNYKHALKIIGTSLLADVWFVKLFSHSVGCLANFLKVSLEAQKMF